MILGIIAIGAVLFFGLSGLVGDRDHGVPRRGADGQAGRSRSIFGGGGGGGSIHHVVAGPAVPGGADGRAPPPPRG